MHLDPSRVILWRWRLSIPDCLKSALVVDLLVAPYPVSPHVCAIQVGFCGIKDHAVDCSLVAVLVILNVLFHATRGVDGEDVAVAGMIVERVAIHGIRRRLCRKEEDGARLGVCVVCSGCRLALAADAVDRIARKRSRRTMASQRKASRVHNAAGALDMMRAPLLHRGAVDVLPLVLYRPWSAIELD
jgi:hypothetical protein